MTYNEERIKAYRIINRQIDVLERKMSLHFNLYIMELQDEMKIEQLKYLISTAEELKKVYKERIKLDESR